MINVIEKEKEQVQDTLRASFKTIGEKSVEIEKLQGHIQVI